MAGKAGAATAAPTTPKRRGRPPGSGAKKPGAKPGPKPGAAKAANSKVFEIFGIGDGKNLVHLATVKGVNTGGAAALKAVKNGDIEADTPVIPVSSRFLTPVKIESEQRDPTYKVTTIGNGRAKKDPNAPKRKYTRRAKPADAAAPAEPAAAAPAPAPVAAAAPVAGSPAEAGNPFAT